MNHQCCGKDPVNFITFLFFFSFPFQLGGTSSYSTQFLSHAGPRGPPGMNPGGMISSRSGLPPSTGGLYPSHPAHIQRIPHQGGYPGGQQGLKRPFHSEVCDPTKCLLKLKLYYSILSSIHLFFFCICLSGTWGGVG